MRGRGKPKLPNQARADLYIQAVFPRRTAALEPYLRPLAAFGKGDAGASTPYAGPLVG
jgi:hypothetical protein